MEKEDRHMGRVVRTSTRTHTTGKQTRKVREGD